MKKLVAYVMALAMIITLFGFNPSEASAAVGSKYIAKVGSSSKSYHAGNYFELEVNKGSKVKDSNLWWSIGNTSIVKFNDRDRSDDDIELKAVKAGTTKVTCLNKLTGGKVVYKITVKKATKTISRVGSSSRTVNRGDDFELAVKLGGLVKSNDVKWTIANTSIVGYDDDDRYDNDMEFYAKKAGTTKITAHNLKTGGKIVYTVKVKQPGNYYISKVGSLSKKVELGDDIDLKVVKGASLTSKQVEWTITDTSILRFEDGDEYGAEVEVEALKLGKCDVIAQNMHTGGKIVYSIEVVPEY